MLRTVKDACILHDSAIDYSMKDQIENLHALIEEEKTGPRFSRRTTSPKAWRSSFGKG
ncbi:MAG: hypothetical protein ACREYE_30130 [Gammaproteobacteria bacterium]